MSRVLFFAAAAAGAAAMIGMLWATLTWMTAPAEIVHRQSSPVRGGAFQVPVVSHGRTYYVSEEQKRALDRIHRRTPLLWFGSLAVAGVALLVGAAARLRMPLPPPEP